MNLRWIIRDGEKILQQGYEMTKPAQTDHGEMALHYLEWEDIPIKEEVENGLQKTRLT